MTRLPRTADTVRKANLRVVPVLDTRRTSSESRLAKRPRPRGPGRHTVAWLLSLVAHLALLLLTVLPQTPRPPFAERDPLPIEIAPWEREEAEVPSEPQVVATSPSSSDRPPESKRFLSERDQSTDRETQVPTSAIGSSQTSADSPGMDELGIAPRSEDTFSSFESDGPVSVDLGFDSLDDVPIGPDTVLNTRKFAHFTYFARMRELLAPLWRPAVQDRVRSLWISGRTPSLDRLTTALAVGLSSDGEVKYVELARSSGIALVDDVAIQAFFSARTFPNPPRALLNEAGEMHMRWNFVVELDRLDRPELPEEGDQRERAFR